MRTLSPTKLLKKNRILGSIVFLATFPHTADAEAFKGGLLPSSAEKTLFFIFVLFGIAALLGAVFLLMGTWEWLQTGKRNMLKKYFPWIFVLLIALVLLAFFILLMSL